MGGGGVIRDTKNRSLPFVHMSICPNVNIVQLLYRTLYNFCTTHCTAFVQLSTCTVPQLMETFLTDSVSRSVDSTPPHTAAHSLGLVDISDPKNVFRRNCTESLSGDTFFEKKCPPDSLERTLVRANSETFWTLCLARAGEPPFVFSFVLAKMARDPIFVSWIVYC